MKSKPFRTVIRLTIFIVLILIGLFCFHQLTKSHLDARQAEFYLHQLLETREDGVRNETLISKQTAIIIASLILSEKYGKWHAFLYKPFDIYLFNNYWFVSGTISKSKSDNRFILIINQYTGEIRVKP